jgi:predicted nucleic acid-binding protein
MVLIDTSCWIEWLIGSPLGDRLGAHFPATDLIIVPTIVQLELAKWLEREKGEDAANRVIALTTTCLVVPLTTELALSAAALHKTHKLATADAIIYATAISHGATLLTCDAHFKGLDSVIFEAKEQGA